MANKKRLIDANTLKERLNDLEAQGGHKYYRAGANCILHEIMPQVVDDQPTVDAVEVVRCCDCCFCDVYQHSADSEVLHFCGRKGGQTVDPTDFCSYGERREKQ